MNIINMCFHEHKKKVNRFQAKEPKNFRTKKTTINTYGHKHVKASQLVILAQKVKVGEK